MSIRAKIEKMIARAEELRDGHRRDLYGTYAKDDDDSPHVRHKECMISYHRGEIEALEEVKKMLDNDS